MWIMGLAAAIPLQLKRTSRITQLKLLFQIQRNTTRNILIRTLLMHGGWLLALPAEYGFLQMKLMCLLSMTKRATHFSGLFLFRLKQMALTLQGRYLIIPALLLFPPPGKPANLFSLMKTAPLPHGLRAV